MYIEKKLKNGLQVLLVPKKETNVVTLLILFKVGSRHESLAQNGIAHLIEHMAFKGTIKRPSALQISKELDRIGASSNAFTGFAYTGYYITAEAEYFDLILDVLSDILINSKFDAKEIEKEKSVILEEIKMYEENPMMHLDDFFSSLIYEGHQLGRNVAGSPKSLSLLDREKIIDFRDKYYYTQNAVLVVAGKVDDCNLDKIEKAFAPLAEKKKRNSVGQKFVFNVNKPKVKILTKELDQTLLGLGFPGYSMFDKRTPALELLSIILGGNMSSRLYTNIREKRGLAYFVNSSVGSFEDVGEIFFSAGLDSSKIETALKAILNELLKIKNNGVTKKELAEVKQYLKGKLALWYESRSQLADHYGKLALYGEKIVTPEEKFKEFFSVTLNEINQLAKEIFDFKKTHLALIGPMADEKKFLKIIEGYFSK